MKACRSCKTILPTGVETCPKCGTRLDGTEPELVEKLTVEATVIGVRGTSFRVINSGTAPLEVTRVIFDRRDCRMTGLSYGNGSLRDGHLFLEPGDRVDLHIEIPFEPIDTVVYPVDIQTQSGGHYPTRVAWP